MAVTNCPDCWFCMGVFIPAIGEYFKAETGYSGFPPRLCMENIAGPGQMREILSGA